MKSRRPSTTSGNDLKARVEDSPARLNRQIQAKLGEQLRQVYNDIVRQGVPDRFAELLARFDSETAKEEKPGR
jgi:hypothetical protein